MRPEVPEVVVRKAEPEEFERGGRFGEICELYVVPDYRSKGVGALLIEAAVSFGRKRGWLGIEVGTPSAPTWQRTIDFYRRHGFEEVGPSLDLTLRRSE
jgi:GNAT superfamily N-acetyltransferase